MAMRRVSCSSSGDGWEETSTGPRDFVLALEATVGTSGVYTCARTRLHCEGGEDDAPGRDHRCVNARKRAVVAEARHVERLTFGSAMTGIVSRSNAAGNNSNSASIESCVCSAFRAAAEAFAAANECSCSSGRCCAPLLLTLFMGGETLKVYWHAMALPTPCTSVDRVLVTRHRTPEGNRELSFPAVKGTSWISQRQPLEAHSKAVASVGEVVMLDSCGEHLLEGLVTNVFVVRLSKNHVVVETACTNVLPGTMRELVISTCRSLGIPVLFSAGPSVSDALSGAWLDLFLTSVNKPVCRVFEIQLETPGSSSPRVVEFKREHSVTSTIRQALVSHFS